jgi:hypothetical protein
MIPCHFLTETACYALAFLDEGLNDGSTNGE